MARHELTTLPATELAARLARGDFTAVDAVDAHIARIEEMNPALNAIVVERFDAARAEARAADERYRRGEPLGPLHGLPVTVKESIDLAGTPSTFGLASRRALLVERDAACVARLRAAGAIVLGKTNVSQCLLYQEADNPVWGRTNHPERPERTCGGSSGGEAAILATGGSALGLGTDIGGSVRVPAAFCGIASLKPTAGRVPDLGRLSIPIGQRAVESQIGVLARTVGDVALGFGVSSTAPAAAKVSRFRRPSKTSTSVILQWAPTPMTAPSLRPPAVCRAVVEASEILRRRGARVVDWTPPDVGRAVGLYYGLLSADGGRGLVGILGRDPRDPRIADLFGLVRRPRPILRLVSPVLRLLGQRTLV